MGKKKHTKAHGINNEPKKEKKMIKKDQFEIITILFILTIFILIISLIFNKSFLTNKYQFKNNKGTIIIKLPPFTYFYKKVNNKLYFNSIRNKRSIENNLESELASSNYVLYNCANHKGSVFYNTKHHFFLYNIQIVNKGLYKKITMQYGQSNENELCQIFDEDIPVATRKINLEKNS